MKRRVAQTFNNASKISILEFNNRLKYRWFPPYVGMTSGGRCHIFMGHYLRFIPLTLLPLFCLLSGCMVGPDYHTPGFDVPEKWVNTEPCPKKKSEDIQKEVTWWENYKDPILTQLVKETIQANYNLKVAFATICQARANLLGAEAKLLPEIDGTGFYNRNESSLNTRQFFNPIGTATQVGPTPPNTTATAQRRFNLYRIGFDTIWEIDLFGRLRRGIEAADASLDAQVENMHGVLLSLIAEVAVNYINLRSYQKQLEITQKSFKEWDSIYKLNQSLLDAGLATEIDVAQAETSRDQTEASLSPLQANIKTTIHQLSVLVGKPPTYLYGLLCKVKPIPQIPQEIFVGIPSTLLKRRPDIRAAERNLAASSAQIGVAEGSLFPIFSFTGSTIGYQSNMASNLFTPNSLFYSFGPGFTWNIVDFGRVRAMINGAIALRDQNLYQYKSTILSALADVETSLVNYASESRHYHYLKRAYAASKKASDLSMLRYESGLINFITVYQTEITYQAAALSMIQSQAALAINSVSLYKALGGGWEIDPICWTEGDSQPCNVIGQIP
jgi:NodT family efflux transporter outer membrane factor (OMF) lipoprotein